MNLYECLACSREKKSRWFSLTQACFGVTHAVKQFGKYYLVSTVVHRCLNLPKFTASLTTHLAMKLQTMNVNISLLSLPKKNPTKPDQLLYTSWIPLDVKKGKWKTCLLELVPDSSNAFLYSAKLNFDYCPAYFLWTASTGFLSFQAFNLCFADARVQLILPCVWNTVFFRSCRSWTYLQILTDT